MPRDEYDDRTFLEKYGIAVAFVAVLLIACLLGAGFYWFNGKIPPPKKPEEIAVHLLPPPPMPPPPPPPPPPKTPPPPQQKMVEMKPQDKTPPKPTPSAPPSAPGPKASGPPSDDGIGGGGGGGGDGVGGVGGSVFGYYASQVGDQIRVALTQNGKTRDAGFRTRVRIWFDNTGRVTRSKLNPSTGDPALDSAITNEVLNGMQLPTPPTGMPTPITMNLIASRPQAN
jgi:TonB family protein